MYRTCIFCHRDLASNAMIESFPIGKQLAFDASKGRLWAICSHCQRWNLTPLEARWEAVEECERLYHRIQTSFSTDNIGLAELGDSLRLVRIGRPKRPEFAAWRYGRDFWQRRVRKVVATTAYAGAWAVSAAAAVIVGGFMLPSVNVFSVNRTTLRVRDPHGRRMYFPKHGLAGARLIREESREAWHLSLPYFPAERRRFFLRRVYGKIETAELRGEDAIYVAGRILPAINAYGGTASQVEQAVRVIQEAGAPERLFHAASDVRGRYRPDAREGDPSRNLIRNMDAEVRLALEMTAHEHTERRALEGELAILEAAWREAEEVAAIADRLLIPSEIESWIERHRSQ